MTTTIIPKKRMTEFSFLIFLSMFSYIFLPRMVFATISFETLDSIHQEGSRLEDIATSADNMLYVVDSNKKQILIYDGNDLLDSTIAVELPTSIAIDGPIIYVGSSKDLSVKMLDLDSGEIVGQLGAGKNEFKLPRNISIDPTSHNIYVVDQLDHSIKVYAADGTYLNKINDSPNLPQDLTIINNEIFVLDQPLMTDKNGYKVRGARINVYDLDGNQTRSFGTFGTARGQILRPKSIISDANDLIYFTDAFHGAVLCFDVDGNFIQTIHDETHPMIAPMGIAIDHTGRLLVTSPFASQLNVYMLNTVGSDNFSPYSLYFPKVEDSENQSFYNIISVQNLAAVAHTISIKAYEASNGTLTTNYQKVIPANGVIRVRPAGGGTEWQTSGNSITGLSDFFGSIIIDADKPIVATNLYVASSGAFTVFESAIPEQSMLFPMVLDNQDQWQTWLTVQNIYETAQSITVNIYDTSGNIAGTDTVSIPAHGLYNIRPYLLLDESWINTHNQGQNHIDGSIVVTCNNSPLVGLLAYQHGETLDSMSIYSSVKSSTELYIPIIRDMPAIFPETTGTFNDLYLTSSTAQTISYEIFYYDGTPVLPTSGQLIFEQANETLIISPAALAGLTPGSNETFEGVMKITATSPIYGLNQVEHMGTTTVPGAVSLAFEFPGQAEKELYFPEVSDGALGWTSMISIQNTVGVDHLINVVFIRQDGQTFIDQYTVPANGAYLLYPGTTQAGGQAGIEGYFQGAIQITTTEPVAAVLQYAHHPDENAPEMFDNLEIYNGLIAPVKK